VEIGLLSEVKKQIGFCWLKTTRELGFVRLRLAPLLIGESLSSKPKIGIGDA